MAEADIDGEPLEDDQDKKDGSSEVLPEHSASQVAPADPKAAIQNAVDQVKSEASKAAKDVKPAALKAGLTKTALDELQRQQRKKESEDAAAELLRYPQLPAVEASRSLATAVTKSIVEAGAGRSNVDGFRLGYEASLHPAVVVEPLFGDLPVAYSPENAAQMLTDDLPRIRKFLEAFPGVIEIPLADYVVYTGAGPNYGATLPAGTMAFPIRVAWREVSQPRTNDGVIDELWAACLLVIEDQPAWVLTRNRVHVSDVTIAEGLDAVLQAAASLVLPTDIRGLALATGLSSSLYSAPNDSAASLTALAGSALAMEVTSILTQMIQLLRSAVLRKLVSMRHPTAVFDWQNPPAAPALALPVPGANAVHIFGGEHNQMGAASLRSGGRSGSWT